MTTIHDAITLDITKVHDTRGNLSVIEGNAVPFEMKRVYYLYDIPSGGKRGGHSHIEQQEFLIALSGSFDVVLHDGEKEVKFSLNRSNFGLYVPNFLWRRIENFSTNTLALIVSSIPYNSNDYIRSFDEFKKLKNEIEK